MRVNVTLILSLSIILFIVVLLTLYWLKQCQQKQLLRKIKKTKSIVSPELLAKPLENQHDDDSSESKNESIDLSLYPYTEIKNSTEVLNELSLSEQQEIKNDLENKLNEIEQQEIANHTLHKKHENSFHLSNKKHGHKINAHMIHKKHAHKTAEHLTHKELEQHTCNTHFKHDIHFKHNIDTNHKHNDSNHHEKHKTHLHHHVHSNHESFNNHDKKHDETKIDKEKPTNKTYSYKPDSHKSKNILTKLENMLLQQHPLYAKHYNYIKDQNQSEKLLKVHILANDRTFSNYELLNKLLENDLHCSKQKIFHKHIKNDANNPVAFSIASANKDITFNLNMNEPHDAKHRGLTLFMPINKESDNHKNLDEMLKTAKLLAKLLNAETYDSNNKIVNNKIIEDLHQKINEETN